MPVIWSVTLSKEERKGEESAMSTSCKEILIRARIAESNSSTYLGVLSTIQREDNGLEFYWDVSTLRMNASLEPVLIRYADPFIVRQESIGRSQGVGRRENTVSRVPYSGEDVEVG